MVTITDKAVNAVKDYLKHEEKENCGLRIVAQQGCCSMQYGFFVTEKSDEGDTVLEHDGVNFYVDKESGQWLSGAKVDFMTGEHGEGFYIDNPNEPQFEGGGGCCGGEGHADGGDGGCCGGDSDGDSCGCG